MKRRFYEIKSDDRRKRLKEFCGMISGVKNEKDAEKFLRDLLTPSEIIMITNRIQIAKMLLGGFNHRDIQKRLGVGFGTISSVNRWLFSGFGGYLHEFQEAKNSAERKRVIPKGEWDIIKKKYPMHFLLFNLADEISKRKNK
jgi:uncharacterized protein YerC